jgi:hypothetical protein
MKIFFFMCLRIFVSHFLQKQIPRDQQRKKRLTMVYVHTSRESVGCTQHPSLFHFPEAMMHSRINPRANTACCQATFRFVREPEEDIFHALGWCGVAFPFGWNPYARWA